MFLAGCSSSSSTSPPTEVPASRSEPQIATPAVVNLPEAMHEAADRLAQASQNTTLAWDRLAYMVDTYGHRLSGSKSLEAAIDWSLETMRKDGLEHVHRQKVMVPHWVRGQESAAIVTPVKRTLNILGLGGTVGTGKKPLRAEVVVVHSLAEISQRGNELAGKIVLINQAMPAYQPETNEPGYGQAVAIRVDGASAAARVGAVALLIRSLTNHSLGAPHTGTLSYAADVAKIPAAALTVEDAEMLERMTARGPVELELKLAAKTLPDAESGNAIGELRGREIPEEIVLIGCHIDSWDVGQGASDDGSGCLMVMEAARMLKALELIPRRTIRVVLFTNEENGLRGAQAYYQEHHQELHVAALEADVGSGAPWGFGFAAEQAEVADLFVYAPLFKRFGADQWKLSKWAGADISLLVKNGVLGIGLWPNVSHYFDLHHSAADTMDKIDPDHLQRNAAAIALLAYILAERT